MSFVDCASAGWHVHQKGRCDIRGHTQRNGVEEEGGDRLSLLVTCHTVPGGHVPVKWNIFRGNKRTMRELEAVSRIVENHI